MQHQGSVNSHYINQNGGVSINNGNPGSCQQTNNANMNSVRWSADDKINSYIMIELPQGSILELIEKQLLGRKCCKNIVLQLVMSLMHLHQFKFRVGEVNLHNLLVFNLTPERVFDSLLTRVKWCDYPSGGGELGGVRQINLQPLMFLGSD